MNNKFCLYSAPFKRPMTVFEKVDAAVAFGLSNIETISVGELADPDPEFVRKLRRYGDERGVTFTCTSVGVDLVRDDRREKIELLKKHAEAAAILGSPYLHHTIALSIDDPQDSIENHELYYRRGVEAVREVYDYAQTLGVRTVFEDQGYIFNGVAGFRRFLQDVDRNVGVVADFGNIMFVDERVEDFIPVFADRIVNVHVKDFVATSKEKRAREPGEYLTRGGNYLRDCPLGKGDVDFAAAFRELEKIGYNGYYALEAQAMGEDQSQTYVDNMKFLNQFVK